MSLNHRGQMQKNSTGLSSPQNETTERILAVKTPLSKRLRNWISCLIESTKFRAEKTVLESESLKNYMSRFLQEKSEMREVEELIESFWEGLEMKGYGYTYLKEAEFNINKRRSRTGHPETQQTWGETLPYLQQIIKIAKTEGRELP